MIAEVNQWRFFMTLRFGILVFPNVQQLDLTGPYEVFASAEGAEVVLIWKDRNPVMSSTRLPLTPTATSTIARSSTCSAFRVGAG